MKRTLSLLLAALFVFAAIGSAAADPGETPADIADLIDENAPYTVKGGEILVDGEVFAGEIVSCLKDKSGALVRAKDGAALASSDKATSGDTLEVGGKSAVIAICGDVNGDAKIGPRDVLAAMTAIVGGEAAGAAADVERDGALNAKDIIKLMKYLVGWDVSLFESAPVAGNEDGALGIYFTSSMFRIARGDMTVYGDPTGVIYTAKNEIEDVHMILTATEARSDLTLEVGEIKNASGDVLEREVRYGHYYDLVIWNNLNERDFYNYTDGYYADPYPTLESAFDMKAGESQSFIFKVKTAADTPAGWYSATVRVLDAAKNEIKKAVFRVYVWDFAIEDQDLSYTTMGMYSQSIAGYFGSQVDKKYFNGAVWAPYYKIWYDYVLENKMCASELPYNVMDSEADAYLDDPRVTSFISLTGKDADVWAKEGTASNLRSMYGKLSQKQEWLDKAYIYTVDEPWDERGINWIKTQWNEAKAALGDIPFQTIVPYYSTWVPSLKMDLTEALWDYCNCFCPDAYVFTKTADRKTRIKDRETYPTWAYYMADDQFEKYGLFEPRYEAMRERGDKMWWYICVTPEYPHANFFITYQGAWSRVVPWQQYRYHSDGFLYWCMIAWDMGEHDSRKINLKRVNGGDGMLLYPGTLWNEEEPLPVPSIRFEVIRDGFEDYAYLRQIERHIGRDETLAYSNRITTDVLRFTQDWHDIDSVRNEMGWYLEELAAN